jgi:chemotaxis receptor (MCP) glutamine deamidase CheD
MSNEVIIKIADLQVAREPAILTTHGLGSCLAICFTIRKLKPEGWPT